jgi:succinate-semialdehyde dehydrogenase/glutarate-semialdehyde dehydrogenase
MAIATINPATGETLQTFEELTNDELEAKLAQAAATAASYRRTTFAERAGWLRAAADLLDAELDDIGRTMTLEMGKTFVAAKAEAAKCATACRFYAAYAEEFLADEPADPVAVNAQAAYARYQPLGVVLAVMPWNFPLWQAMRFAAPALMAGNVGLLKHASNVPRSALYMEGLFARAGFPAGTFQTLLIGSGKIEAVLRDRRVAAATLTGSEPAGAAVGSVAGGAIKTTVLELGGSDPFVVMPSADLDAAVATAVVARCQNNGQSCIAAKRFIVHEEIAERFEERFASAMAAQVVGDPFDAATDVGPLATEAGRSDVVELVDDAVTRGAKLLCGGDVPSGPGWFYPPTVLAAVTPEMRVYGEEVFGPVATVIRVRDIDEAIAVANATEFGLGANAWSTNPAEQDRFVAELDAGLVFINGMVTSYPELPFGGVKSSGYGRELAAHGIRAFCNLKAVWIGPARSATTGAHTE